MRKMVGMAVVLSLVCALFSACGGGKERAVALNTVYIYKMAGITKPEWKPVQNFTAFVKRGEALTVIAKHKEMEDWYQVQLSDGVTKGWIQAKDIHIGERAPVTFTKEGKSYERPDEASPSRKISKGETALILKRLENGWVRVNFAFRSGKYDFKGRDGWVQEDSFERGLVEIKPEDQTEKVSTGVGEGEVSASSFLKESGGYSYNPKNAFDGNMASTWQEGVDGSGIGQWLEVKFAESKFVDIFMVNGFNHSDDKYGDLYDANCRVSRIKISYGANLEQSVTTDLMDGVKEFQKIAGGIQSTRFRFTILDVYKGSKWQDTAISEIKFTAFDPK